MSRFNDYDGDNEIWNGGNLWSKRAQLALEGRRGRKALADLREALLALPKKELIEGALCTVGGAERERAEIEKGYPIDGWLAKEPNGLPRRDEYIARDLEELGEIVRRTGEGVCAIGAYVWWQKVKGGMDPDAAFAALPTLADSMGDGDYGTADIGKEHGLTWTLAWELASRNDETWGGMAPDVRYIAFLGWIDKQLAKPLLTRPAPRQRRRAKATPVVPTAHQQAAGL
jgi:hypothetical protein